MAILDTLKKKYYEMMNPVKQGISNVDNFVFHNPNTGFQRIASEIKNNPAQFNVLSRQNVQQNIPKAQYLSTVKTGIKPVDYTLNVGGNMASNTIKTFGSGQTQTGQGITAFKEGRPVEGLLKTSFGLTKMAAVPVNKYFQVANLVASQPKKWGTPGLVSPDPNVDTNKDQLRRIAAGFMQGMSGEQSLASNVPDRNVSLLGNEFDPYKFAGNMVGFTKNPMWKSIYPLTSKLEGIKIAGPAVNFIISRGVKGGTEGLLQGYAELPDNLTPQDRFKYLAKQGLFGAGSEIMVGAGGKAVNRAMDTQAGQELTKILDSATGKIQKEWKKAWIPVEGSLDFKTGKRIVKPLWMEQLDKWVEKYNPGQSVSPVSRDSFEAAILKSEQPKGLTPEVTTSPVTLPNQPEINTQGLKNTLMEQPNLGLQSSNTPLVETQNPTQIKLKQVNPSDNIIQGKLRGFPETVIDTKGIPKEVADFAKTQTYEPLANKTVLKTVSKIVQRGDSQAIQFAKTDETVNGNATAMVMIRKLIDKGRYDEVNDLIKAVSPRFTKQGQEIQILSQFSRLKPEGAIRYAQNLIERANKANPKLKLELTPENTRLITERAKAIEGLAEGSRERIVATAQLMKEITNVVPVSIGQKLSSFQTMMQLLNFKTPVRNILGNTIFGGLENVSDVVGTGIDKVASLFTGQRSKVLPSLKAQGQGFLRGGSEGMQDVKLGIDTSGGINSQYDLPSQTFRTGVLNKLEKALNITLRVPDRAASTAAFEGSLNNQMRAAGVNKPTPQMVEVATSDALYRTFQDNSKLAQVFGGAKKLLNKIGTPDGKFGLGDFILKYPKTPANILSRGIDYTPGGLVKALYEVTRPLIAGQPFNQKAFVEDLSRSLVGSGVISAAYMLAKNGIVSGRSPKDYDVSATQQSSGGGQFKINTSALKRFVLSGGQKQEQKTGDVLVSYDWAQPTSLMFSMGADMALNGTTKNSISDSLDTATTTLTSQPLVQGVTNLAKDIQDNGVGTALTKTIYGAPSGFVPSILNQFASVFDSTGRSTYDPNKLTEAKNKVISRIPGLRNTLQPSVDVFGNEKKNYESQGLMRIIDVMFNPAFVSTVKDNPSAKEVLDIYSRSGETSQAPRVVPKTVKINGENIKVTPEQYTQYQKYVGTKTQQVFDSLVTNPTFQKANDEDKAKLMASTLSDINSAAKIELFGNKPKNVDNGTKGMINLKTIQGDGKTITPVSFTKEGNLKLSSTDITPPKLTGNSELDKKLISSYNSDLNTAKNDIVNNYKNGSITATEANKQLVQLSSLKLAGTKKLSLAGLKAPKLPKIKISKGKTPKIKLAKIKTKTYKFKSIKLAKSKAIKLKKIA